MKKTFIFLGLISALLLGLFLSRDTDDKSSYEKYIVQRKNITYLKNLNGYIESDRNIEISSSVTGFLQVVHYQKNDNVEKGDVLFEVDDSKEHKLLSELRLNEKKTVDLIHKLDKEYADAIELLGIGGTSAIETKEILFRLQQAQLDLQILHSQIERAEINIEKYKITSPFSGIVATINISQSELVKSGQVLSTMADTSRKKIKTYIDEFDGGSIQEGLKVRIIPMKDDQVIYRGKVSSIATFFESSQGLKKLEATIVPIDSLDNLKIGQNVRLEVLIAQADNVPVIDRKYLFSKEQNHYVKKLIDGEVSKVPVQVGIKNAHEVEIIGGLQVGDTLVLDSV